MRSPYVRLVEVDPVLGAGLDPEAREEARRLAVAPLVTLPRGNWSSDELVRRIGKPCRFGCLVVEGLIAHEIVLQGRSSTQLLGRGDLLSPVPVTRVMPNVLFFGVTDSASVAVLDALPALARRWPTIATGLLARSQRQAERAALQHAISQLRRAEDRIIAVFWQLGDRWGSLADDRVAVPLSLGHEAVAQLVGGRRSTITAALGRLAADDLLTRRPDGTWTLATRSSVLVEPPLQAPRNPDARLVPPRERVSRA